MGVRKSAFDGASACGGRENMMCGAGPGAGALAADDYCYDGKTGATTSNEVLADMRPKADKPPYNGYIPDPGQPELVR